VATLPKGAEITIFMAFVVTVHVEDSETPSPLKANLRRTKLAATDGIGILPNGADHQVSTDTDTVHVLGYALLNKCFMSSSKTTSKE
jgi:hypothetical protein